MSEEIPTYIQISVEAVGGAETEAGKEMLRLLTERAGLAPKSAQPETASLAVEQEPAADSLMPPALETLFQTVLTEKI